MVVETVLKLVASKGIKNLHIFGDSLLVIVWIQLKRPPKKILLRPIYEDICKVPNSFEYVTLHHIYSEQNVPIDQL